MVAPGPWGPRSDPFRPLRLTWADQWCRSGPRLREGALESTLLAGSSGSVLCVWVTGRWPLQTGKWQGKYS
jgi:hypothetical protein